MKTFPQDCAYTLEDILSDTLSESLRERFFPGTRATDEIME